MISEARKKHLEKLGTLPRTDIWKNNISVSRKGKPHPHKKDCQCVWHRSKSGIERKPFTTEHCKAISDWHKGKKMPEEQKKKIGLKMKGRTFSAETIKKMSANSHWRTHGLSKTREYIAFKTRQRDLLKRKAIGKHTIQEWNKLKENYNFQCLCCLKREPEIKLTEDHVIPLILGGENSINNLQPLCHSCNSRKGARIIDYRYEQ